jgi:CHAD domain-containing protein
MSFYLKTDESSRDAFFRIGMEEIDTALTYIEKKKPAKAVHKVRTRCKRIRALARLYRDALGKDHYKKVNVHFRDLARKLSDLRDTKTMLDTYHEVVEEWSDKGWKLSFDDLEESLQSNRKAERKKELDKKEIFEDVVKELEKGRELLEHSSKKIDEDPALLAKGLARIYGRGQSALETVIQDGSVTEYHELRKRVKYLMYVLKLLKKSWPPLIKPLANELSDVSDDLGDDHDLAVLLEFAEGELGRCNKKRLEFLQAVIPLSIRFRQRSTCKLEFIYIESPEDFAKRIIAYFERSQLG